MTELGIIGDIHGHLDPLRRLVDNAMTRTEQFVFLGDYVNRGPKSRQVIDYLSKLPSRGLKCVFLAGNHDRAFLAALDGAFDAFLMVGGAATVRSYIEPPYVDVTAEFVEAVPPSHRSFLVSLADDFVTDDLYVAHRRPPGSADGKFHVGGHAPQHGAVPAISRNGAFIDTGCGTLSDGTLTCFFWPSRDWISQPAR